MPHVSLKTVLEDAKARKYGIPCLWAGSVEKTIGHVAAAEQRNSPLILCYNYALCPKLPVEIGVPLIVNAATLAKVPVATTLDHGSGIDMASKCIHYGASSVMFDGSNLPLDENVRITKEIVRFAKPLGVSVEAELGSVGGSVLEMGASSSAESTFTNPDEAQAFVQNTGVDALAISFGNVHGKYQGEPRLDLDRVRRIAELVDIPLVMHGASGLSDSDYPRIIGSGVSKINYYSAMARRAAHGLKEWTSTADEELTCHNVISWNIDFFTEDTKELLDLLGCSGKADGMSSRPAGRAGASSDGVNSSLADDVSQIVHEVLKRING